MISFKASEVVVFINYLIGLNIERDYTKDDISIFLALVRLFKYVNRVKTAQEEPS